MAVKAITIVDRTSDIYDGQSEVSGWRVDLGPRTGTQRAC
jgi:hypothetical protein